MNVSLFSLVSLEFICRWNWSGFTGVTILWSVGVDGMFVHTKDFVVIKENSS